MSELKFIRASKGPKYSVVYETADDRKFCYSNGDPAWRTNNPVNLHSGGITNRNGQIGKFGKFAIFPDYQSGHQAHLDCLRTTYRNHSLEEMIKGYAPKHENKTAKYLRFLRDKTGVKDDKKIKDFTSEEFEKLWKTIEIYEGKKTGEIRECTEKRKPEKKKEEKSKKLKIIGIQRNKKRTIIAYLIEFQNLPNRFGVPFPSIF